VSSDLLEALGASPAALSLALVQLLGGPLAALSLALVLVLVRLVVDLRHHCQQ